MVVDDQRAAQINQLRLDPLSGRWVVVSTVRAQRPAAFVLSTSKGQVDTSRPCPFCPGHEEASPPALETYGPTGAWLVRVVPNLYPAFDGDEPFVVTNRGPVFTQATAGGIHEVLILSPEHDASWSMLSDEQTGLVMAALRDRIEEHSQRSTLRYSQAIVNSGREAGASLDHPHGQLHGHVVRPAGAGRGAGPVRPVRRQLPAVHDRRRRGGARATGSSTPTTGSSSSARSGARRPYEMLVIPRAHSPHLHRSPTEDLVSVGLALKACLGQLRDSIGDVAYNLVFHSAPYRVNEPFHWHVHVWPKATTRAGFEMGTGVAINVVNPEQAAEQLRVAVPTSLTADHLIGPPVGRARRPHPTGLTQAEDPGDRSFPDQPRKGAATSSSSAQVERLRVPDGGRQRNPDDLLRPGGPPSSRSSRVVDGSRPRRRRTGWRAPGRTPSASRRAGCARGWSGGTRTRSAVRSRRPATRRCRRAGRGRTGRPRPEAVAARGRLEVAARRPAVRPRTRRRSTSTGRARGGAPAAHRPRRGRTVPRARGSRPRPPAMPGVRGDPADVAAHHLADDHPVVRLGRRAQAVDGVGRHLDRGVEAERHLGPRQVVVDRLRHADRGHPERPEPVGHAERVVAADRHERRRSRAPPASGRTRSAPSSTGERVRARRAEDRAADGSAGRGTGPARGRRNGPLHHPPPAVEEPDHLVTVDHVAGEHDGPDDRVQARDSRRHRSARRAASAHSSTRARRPASAARTGRLAEGDGRTLTARASSKSARPGRRDARGWPAAGRRSRECRGSRPGSARRLRTSHASASGAQAAAAGRVAIAAPPPSTTLVERPQHVGHVGERRADSRRHRARSAAPAGHASRRRPSPGPSAPSARDGSRRGFGAIGAAQADVPQRPEGARAGVTGLVAASAGSAGATCASTPVSHAATVAVRRPKARSRATCIRRRHRAERPGLGAEVAPGLLRRQPRAYRSRNEVRARAHPSAAPASSSCTTPRSRPPRRHRASGAARWLKPASSRRDEQLDPGMRPVEDASGKTVSEHRSPKATTTPVVVVAHRRRPLSSSRASPVTASRRSEASRRRRRRRVDDHRRARPRRRTAPRTASSPGRSRCSSSPGRRRPSTAWAEPRRRRRPARRAARAGPGAATSTSSSTDRVDRGSPARHGPGPGRPRPRLAQRG